jgi:class 3 adenylate cyclase
VTVTNEFNTSSDDAERFASLVPQLAVEMAREPGNHHQTIEGSMLSADISGFTALSEKLAAKGKAGAEEITELINICFTELIDAAYAYGGEVIKFGGDALLVLFRGDDHMTRVAAAGLDMQHALHSSPAAKKANLTMTVGASEGPFEAFLVGSSQRDLIIAGTNASHVIHLEGEAEKGDTVVSNGIADALPDTLRVAEHAGGWIISGTVDQQTSGPLERTTGGVDLSSLVPESVGTHFEGFAGLGGEHRIVTVGFLSVTGLDEHLADHGPGDTRDALGDLVDAVVDSCAEFGVTPLHTDIAPNGLKFVLCAGAPYTEGNTSEAMLEAALRITKLTTPFTIKIGVQRGRVFAGFLGSPFRRTYTLMGDPVNTAARMLGKAANKDIVAVDDVLADTRTIYAAEEIEPFLVKGKTEPMRASYVFGTTDWVQKQAPVAPLIGRDAELASLIDALESDRYAVQLVGPAGSGKTRLLDEIRVEVSRRMIEKIEAHCSPYSASTPYALLQIVLRRTAEIEANADPITAGELLYKAVRHHQPELLPMLPILAIPAGAEVDSTPEASAIDAKFLRDRIHEVSARFIRAVLPEDVIFILEDMQWVDDASADFLEYTLQHQASDRWTALISSRPDGNWAIDDDPATRRTITLEPLTDELVRSLVIEASTTDLPDTVLDRIVPQALGNPLYALELTKAVESSDGDDIPDSVEQLVSARIDALDADARHLLRVASVLGNQFSHDDLKVIAGNIIDDLSSVGEFVSELNRGSFEFNNALYRDVSYEGLPFQQRKRLHRKVGDHLESTLENPKAMAGLLASHFSIAGDRDRTWTYGVAAGDRAAHQAANVEAVASYQRAVDAAARLKTVPHAERLRVQLALGDGLAILGRFEKAERAFSRARKLAVTAADHATCMVRIGNARERQGDLEAAGRWYTRAGEMLPRQSVDEVDLQAQSTVHFRQAGLAHRQANQTRAVHEARLALGAAEDANDLVAMANALHRLHLANTYAGRPDRIGYGAKALEMFEELGDHERQASVLNNLGIEHYFAGRWSSAVECYERATEEGVRSGSLIDGLMGALNAGEILSDQGRWDEAIELLGRARRNWEGGRYPIGLAAVKLYLGVAHSRRGETTVASDLLKEAHQEITDLGLDELSADSLTRIYEHESFLELHTVTDADLNENPNTAAFGSRIERSRAIRLVLEAKSTEAIRILEAQLGSNLEGFERALTLRTLAHVNGDESIAAEAQAIFDTLGVVQVRPLPIA